MGSRRCWGPRGRKVPGDMWDVRGLWGEWGLEGVMWDIGGLGGV